MVSWSNPKDLRTYGQACFMNDRHARERERRGIAAVPVVSDSSRAYDAHQRQSWNQKHRKPVGLSYNQQGAAEASLSKQHKKRD